MENKRPFAHCPAPLTDDDLCGLGTHKNTKLKDVPIQFFYWMAKTQNENPRVDRGRQWRMVLNYIESFKNIKINENTNQGGDVKPFCTDV